jgi:hypothetical protein
VSLYGCIPGLGEWHITLYEQKIEGTSKAIYKYDAWGGMDSHEFGYTVRDTTENFTISGINKIQISQLAGIPNKNEIQAIYRVRVPYKERQSLVELFVPIEIKESKIEGLKIKTKLYQDKDFSKIKRGHFRYEFSNFKETRDSIIFYDLNDIISKHKSPHRDSLKIKKGHVILRERENKGIVAIEIEDLVISVKGRDSLISKIRYDLTPKSRIELSEFTSYGVFKEKSTEPNKT